MARRKEVDHKLPELPRSPQVGDLIRVREDHRNAIAEACELAGWDVDLERVREVIREDPWAPGGGRRLFVDGPPFAFTALQVQLAWPGGAQCLSRREAITMHGWRP